MRRWQLPILAILACLLQPTPSGAGAMTAVNLAPPGPVITRIVQRHRVIVARAGQQGPTYSVETRAGEVLSPDMTLDQLAQHKPQLHREIRRLQDAVTYAGVE